MSEQRQAGTRPEDCDTFYRRCLEVMLASDIEFLVGGGHAVNSYLGTQRRPKDLDLFCRRRDAPRLLDGFGRLGFRTEVADALWLAKIRDGSCFADVIFDADGARAPVSDDWFADRFTARLFGVEVRLVPPTETVWHKAFVQHRSRYDGADIAHLILKQSAAIDWHRLLRHMEDCWEVLLAHVLNFQFIYPSERDRVPRWVIAALASRLAEAHWGGPPAAEPRRICRGRMFSPSDYRVDVEQWGFEPVPGDGPEQDGQRHEDRGGR